MDRSNYWAYRVYWKQKGKTVARSEQFRKKKDAKEYKEYFILKGRIKKEKATKLQKAESKISKKTGISELLIPY